MLNKNYTAVGVATPIDLAKQIFGSAEWAFSDTVAFRRAAKDVAASLINLSAAYISLQADKERLDWIEKRCCDQDDDVDVIAHGDTGQMYISYEGATSMDSQRFGPHKTLREAIDAARALAAQESPK